MQQAVVQTEDAVAAARQFHVVRHDHERRAVPLQQKVILSLLSVR